MNFALKQVTCLHFYYIFIIYIQIKLRLCDVKHYCTHQKDTLRYYLREWNKNDQSIKTISIYAHTDHYSNTKPDFPASNIYLKIKVGF